jgi:short-subunit dehydrogenase
MKNLENRKILITGASSGIGKATAEALATYNPRLILIARNSEGLSNLAFDLKTRFPQLSYPTCLSCDITNPKEIEDMVNTCERLFGTVDILINNAGYGVYGESVLTTLEDFKEVMNVNFFGAINCMYSVLPMMKRAGRGQIINIASVAALHGIPYLSAYGASKAALASVSQSLRAELFDTDIKVNVIYPGYTKTNFFRNEKKVGLAVRPTGPYMPPEKVAKGIIKTIFESHGDRVIGREGHMLKFLKDISPGFVEFLLKKIATRLRP